MERYSTYKDSGIDWIGEIPEHWEIRKLKHLLEKTNSGIWGNNAKNNLDDIVCFRTADFNYSKGCLKENNLTKRNILPKDLYNRLLKKGDILIEKSGGGDLYPVGRAVRNQTDLRAVCSNFLQFIRIKETTNANYIYYYLTASYSKGITTLFFNQTTGIQNLKIGEYLKQYIPLPPLSEQIKIAEYLDRVTGKIDTAIDNSQRMIDLLTERKQIIIQHAVTKGLNPKAKLSDSGIDWIGEIPEHWRVVSMNKIANLYTGNSINERDKSSKYSNVSGMEYIGTKDISFTNNVNYENGIAIPNKYIKKFKIAPAQSVLLCIEGGSAGRKIAHINRSVCFGNKLCCFDFYKSINPRYAYFYLQSSSFSDNFKVNLTGLIGGVNINKVKTLFLLLPPLPEQKKIAEYLDRVTGKIDKAIEAEENKIKLLTERKQIIISETVTGKVKVI